MCTKLLHILESDRAPLLMVRKSGACCISGEFELLVLLIPCKTPVVRLRDKGRDCRAMGGGGDHPLHEGFKEMGGMTE